MRELARLSTLEDVHLAPARSHGHHARSHRRPIQEANPRLERRDILGLNRPVSVLVADGIQVAVVAAAHDDRAVGGNHGDAPVVGATYALYSRIGQRLLAPLHQGHLVTGRTKVTPRLLLPQPHEISLLGVVDSDGVALRWDFKEPAKPSESHLQPRDLKSHKFGQELRPHGPLRYAGIVPDPGHNAHDAVNLADGRVLPAPKPEL
mmetsp:Transcript_96949/g.301805  ORF Transcript_96949/g.301805 Transcript_96949/m.301805 type:complete len:206 (-) Transcript_96949:1040-1657(-)